MIIKKVVVASHNPVKVTAVENAFAKMFDDSKFSIESVSVESDVSDQPFRDGETYQGYGISYLIFLIQEIRT